MTILGRAYDLSYYLNGAHLWHAIVFWWHIKSMNSSLDYLYLFKVPNYDKQLTSCILWFNDSTTSTNYVTLESLKDRSPHFSNRLGLRQNHWSCH